MDSALERAIICSAMCGLLGNVTPNLRAVNIIENAGINLYFYYDYPPSEDEAELANLTDTEILADFGDVPTDFKVIHLPYPEPIPDGLRIFERYEEPLSMMSSVHNFSQRPYRWIFSFQ